MPVCCRHWKFRRPRSAAGAGIRLGKRICGGRLENVNSLDELRPDNRPRKAAVIRQVGPAMMGSFRCGLRELGILKTSSGSSVPRTSGIPTQRSVVCGSAGDGTVTTEFAPSTNQLADKTREICALHRADRGIRSSVVKGASTRAMRSERFARVSHDLLLEPLSGKRGSQGTQHRLLRSAATTDSGQVWP